MDPTAQSAQAETAPPFPCAGCGYPLADLSETAHCPECGLSVAATRRGPLLEHADADWRSQLHTGSVLVLIGPTIAIAIIVLVMLWAGLGMLIGADSAAAGSPTWIFSVAMTVAAGLLMRGWWLLTHDEPDAPVSPGSHTLNLILRITSIAFFVVLALAWVVESALDWLGGADAAAVVRSAAVVPTGLLGITHLVASMLYFARIAARIPSPKTAREFRRSAWIFGIAGVLEGIHRATGWRPQPVASSLISGLLSFPIVLLNLAVAMAMFVAPLWYAYSALWLWRRLRRIQAIAPPPPPASEEDPGPA